MGIWDNRQASEQGKLGSLGGRDSLLDLILLVSISLLRVTDCRLGNTFLKCSWARYDCQGGDGFLTPHAGPVLGTGIHFQGSLLAGLSWCEHIEKFFPSSSVNITTFVHAWRKFPLPQPPCCGHNKGTCINEMNKNTVIFFKKKNGHLMDLEDPLVSFLHKMMEISETLSQKTWIKPKDQRKMGGYMCRG